MHLLRCPHLRNYHVYIWLIIKLRLDEGDLWAGYQLLAGSQLAAGLDRWTGGGPVFRKAPDPRDRSVSRHRRAREGRRSGGPLPGGGGHHAAERTEPLSVPSPVPAGDYKNNRPKKKSKRKKKHKRNISRAPEIQKEIFVKNNSYNINIFSSGNKQERGTQWLVC